MVVGQGLKLVLVGLVAGMAASCAVARAVSSFLYQTESHDVVTFAVVPAVLVVIALAACVLPAWRAARVDRRRSCGRSDRGGLQSGRPSRGRGRDGR